jgi:tagatose 1,6-diphosphate aldolase
MSKNNKLQLGKQWGLRRMANAQGHFTMVALDQRPPIINLIAAKRSVAAADVAFADVLSIKHLLVDVLGPYSSAMLLDPNYAFPAALASLPARTGLVVTLEEHKFEETPDGRRSANIDNWSVAKIKRAGGDGVKVLAWYRPDASTEICEYQKAYSESQTGPHQFALQSQQLKHLRRELPKICNLECPHRFRWHCHFQYF